MMKDVKELFIDTNILVYATNQKSPLYDQANKKLILASAQGAALIISPQIIREYLSATTRNLANSKTTYSDIIYNIQMFQADFYMVDDNKMVISALEKLIETYSVSGKQVHDANIVATMQVYGIKHLLTHNVDDFNRYNAVISIIPLL